MSRRVFRGWDAVVLAALLALSVSFPWGGRGPEGALEIESDAGRRVVPLEPPRRLEVPGPLGPTVVEVGPGGARISASPCPNQLCVRAGEVRRGGGAVACVPNRVVVRVVGGAGPPRGGVDAVAR